MLYRAFLLSCNTIRTRLSLVRVTESRRSGYSKLNTEQATFQLHFKVEALSPYFLPQILKAAPFAQLSTTKLTVVHYQQQRQKVLRNRSIPGMWKITI